MIRVASAEDLGLVVFGTLAVTVPTRPRSEAASPSARAEWWIDTKTPDGARGSKTRWNGGGSPKRCHRVAWRARTTSGSLMSRSCTCGRRRVRDGWP
jgi:hypothetical protein